MAAAVPRTEPLEPPRPSVGCMGWSPPAEASASEITLDPVLVVEEKRKSRESREADLSADAAGTALGSQADFLYTMCLPSEASVPEARSVSDTLELASDPTARGV